ncbi:MAG: PQQ-binding-like beta-propeller repeat protein [Phaeodactylibacter sp.]|uniref:outer membrane protein assembly factor BamB family protein n=1 Tax=Phaeodactylibacter sp. TaxID=1940289 RepID=UPI0032EFC99A
MKQPLHLLAVLSHFGNFYQKTSALRTISLFSLFFLILPSTNLSAQDVAFCGWDGVGGDEFTFVLLRDHTAGEIIYFTEEDYSDVANGFDDGEGHLAYTVPAGGLTENTVIQITETGVDAYTVTGGGTAVHVVGTGNWSFSESDELYAYSSDTPDAPWGDVDEMHCFAYFQNLSLSSQPDQDPSSDFPNCIILDFSPSPGNGTYNFNDPSRVNTTLADLQNPANWTNSGITDITLSTTNFTNQMIVTAMIDCPSVGAVSTSVSNVCANDPFDVTATGLANLANADNNEQDFGIQFRAFTSTPADPYVGGIVLGTVPFGSLTGGNTTAALVGTSSATSGTLEVYAILNPAPTDVNCRPSAMTTITVVNDIEDPIVTCVAADVFRNNDPGQCTYTAQGTEFDPTATDNCGVTSLTNNYNSLTTLAGETFPIGATQVRWTALDAIGNSDTCSVKVVVTAIDAMFTAPADLCINAGVKTNLGGGTPAGGMYSGDGVFDNGDGTYDFDPAAAGVGTTMITYTVGAAGCTDAASDNIEVFAPPTITTPPTDQSICAGDEATFSVAASGSGNLNYQWQQTCPAATEWTVYNTTTGPSGFPDINVRGVYESGGVIYAATNAGGVATLDVAGGATAWTVYNTTTGPSGFPNNSVFGVYESGGVIYAATNGGVATLDVAGGATAWTVYNTTTGPSGFPNNVVYGVYESDGVIYAATQGGGLAALDVAGGATAWTVYNTTSGPSGFPDNFVSGVYESGGVIYAATFGGVATLDVAGGATAWTVYNTSTGPSGFPNDFVLGVYESGGVIYAATFGGGVATLDVAGGAMAWTVYNTTTGPSGFPSNNVFGVYESGGVIYAATANGLAALDVAGGAMAWTVYNTTAGPSGFPDNDVRGVYESGGVIYAATANGLAALDTGTPVDIPNATADTYTFNPTAADADCTYQVVVSDGNGCSVTSEAASVTITPAPNAGDDGATTVCDNSTITINLRDLITDEEPNGTWTQLTGNGGTFDVAAGTFTPAIGATSATFQYEVSGTAPCLDDISIATVNIDPSPTITTPPTDQSICAGDEATFSVAASGSGNLSYQWQQSCPVTEWTVYNTTTGPSGFPDNLVKSVYESSGVIYAAIFGSGLATLDVAGGATAWTVYNTTTGPSGFPNNFVIDVYESGGVIYAATQGGGLATLDVAGGASAWTVYSTTTGPSGLPSNTVSGVYESDGVIYAANSGVATLDVAGGATAWTVYNTTTGPSGFPDNDVFGVYESGGVIYAATFSGVATLDVAGGATAWTVYNTTTGPSGFPDNFVSSVYESGGVIYAGTEGGVATLDVAGGATVWTVYNATTGPSGFPGISSVLGVYESEGVIYAGTEGGVATLDVAGGASAWTVYNTTTGPSGFPNNSVNGVYESGGVIYAATNAGGVATLDTGTPVDIPNATVDTYTFNPTAADADCTYQVVVSDGNGCSVTSEAASVTIETCIVPVEIVLEDPCSCLNNASIIDLDAGTGGDDGQFAELVTLRGVGGAALADNLDYRVVSILGGIDAGNIPTIGDQSNGTAIAPGTAFTFNAMTGFYELEFVHVDEVGYTLVVQQYVNDVAGGDQYEISNTCAYPNPVLNPALDLLYCPNADQITLGGTDQNGLGFDDVSFTIDGMTATVFNPSALTVGPHTVVMTWDGAAGTNDGTGTVGNPNYPGCIQQVQTIIQVNDTEAPMAICPAVAPVVMLDAAGNGTLAADALAAGNSTDNCSVSESSPATNFSCMDVGTQTVVLTATDGINSVMADCMVTVEDNVPPMAICQNVTVQLDANGNGSTTPAAVNNMSSDNCGIASLALDVMDFTCTDVGPNTVTLTVTDVNANPVTCTATVTVEDNVTPMAICQNLTVQLDANGNGSTTPAAVNNMSSDNCGIASLALDVMDFSCADVGPNTVTLTVTDVNGNSTTCTATVTVEDNIAPTAFCLNTTVELKPDGTYTLQESDVYDAANSTDNCSISSVSFPGVTYTCDDAGLDFPVMVTIEDPSGNMDDCTAIVTVEDSDELPLPWTANDIGDQGNGSTYAYDPCAGNNPNQGDFTISTGGYNLIPQNSDNLAFASVPLCGNGGIQTRIESVQGGYAGLMIRESSAPGAKMVAVYANLTNLLRRETRTVTNGSRSSSTLFAPFPTWLRLVRQGDYIRAFYRNSNGGSWQLFHQAYLPMGNCVEMGLAVFTTDPNGDASAVFGNVRYLNQGNANLSVPNNLTWETATPELPKASVLPNPVRNAFTLRFSLPLTAEGTATLLNEFGQRIAQQPLRTGETELYWDAKNLPAGLYFLEAMTEDGYREVLKVVRQ